MGTVVKGVFKGRLSTQLQFVRYKTKVNVTRPRPPHYERALLETVCLPQFQTRKIPQYLPDYELCAGRKIRIVEEKDHPLKTLLAKQNIEYFENSKLVAFFHLNSLTNEEKFQYKVIVKNNGMKLLFLNAVVLKTALRGTPYEAVLDLYKATTATVICPDPNIGKLLSYVKKIPKLSLMGAIVENRLLSLTQLQTYGMFKNITEVRSALISVLNSASQNLVQKLNYHPSNLTQLLNQQKNILEGKK